MTLSSVYSHTETFNGIGLSGFGFRAKKITIEKHAMELGNGSIHLGINYSVSNVMKRNE